MKNIIQNKIFKKLQYQKNYVYKLVIIYIMLMFYIKLIF
jgi:hypothetical protein